MRRIAFLPALLAACGGGAVPASAPALVAPAPSLDVGPPASPAMEPGVSSVEPHREPILE